MSAVISPCGKYRYRLTRSVGMADRAVAFIGVNPSTADAETDDATIRKMCGFARRWGYDRIEVVNLFAWRATDVRKLAKADNPVGPENDAHIRSTLASVAMAVPCWGSLNKLPDALRGRVERVREVLYETPIALCCLGLTKDRDPKHPLMLGYSTPLSLWPDCEVDVHG